MKTLNSTNKHKGIVKQPHSKNTDKVWCIAGEHYQYVESCKAKCKKKHTCEAYGDYMEPRLL